LENGGVKAAKGVEEVNEVNEVDGEQSCHLTLAAENSELGMQSPIKQVN
jgi:hypothetical protein